MIDLSGHAGFTVQLEPRSLTLAFGEGVTAEPAVVRRLDDVRALLRDPLATGPDHLYTIYMGIRVPGRAEALSSLGLGYGAVVYNHGALGEEALRSQGHVHSVPAGTGVAFSEIYEFWYGHGLVYMQDSASTAVSDAVAIEAGPGDKVVVPPGWAHATVNLGGGPLVFGAVYALEARLLYEPLRRLRGMAHYVLADGTLEANPRYGRVPEARRLPPHVVPEHGIVPGRPALAGEIGPLDLVSRPERYPSVWERLQARSRP